MNIIPPPPLVCHLGFFLQSDLCDPNHVSSFFRAVIVTNGVEEAGPTWVKDPSVEFHIFGSLTQDLGSKIQKCEIQQKDP